MKKRVSDLKLEACLCVGGVGLRMLGQEIDMQLLDTLGMLVGSVGFLHFVLKRGDVDSQPDDDGGVENSNGGIVPLDGQNKRRDAA